MNGYKKKLLFDILGLAIWSFFAAIWFKAGNPEAWVFAAFAFMSFLGIFIHFPKWRAGEEPPEKPVFDLSFLNDDKEEDDKAVRSEEAANESEESEEEPAE